MCYRVKTPSFFPKLFPSLIWNVRDSLRSIYLTFDDGPTIEYTNWILDQLKEYNAHASFFLIGKNAKAHPDLVSKIKVDGHVIGNHTFGHKNGWKTSLVNYVQDTEDCNTVFQTRLFRPPYGRITGRQVRTLRSFYKIIMWDVLSGDFDKAILPSRALRNVIENTKAGSIVVFHDSEKAAPRMLYALPRVLEYFSTKGFRFDALPWNG